ncbi:hypothetical protein OHT77_15615 [Streptomyces sp. NBC_00252]|uniref:hypothetical protein n=1 Tax=Streptomyces sp. NBC_00252 TaxID=2975691 RepID=UPI002E2B456A|nr:hypothetical protein [Streptomyces sp. NBC_00252]
MSTESSCSARPPTWTARHASFELDMYRTLYAEAAVDRASTMAAHAAFDFLKFDLDHASAHLLGPIGPGSPEFDAAGGSRPYVWQEFLVSLACTLICWRHLKQAHS